jgi:hypothetical protein
VHLVESNRDGMGERSVGIFLKKMHPLGDIRHHIS